MRFKFKVKMLLEIVRATYKMTDALYLGLSYLEYLFRQNISFLDE